MSDPFARPSSRQSSRRYSFDPSGSSPLPPFGSSYSSSGSTMPPLSLPRLSELSLDSPLTDAGPYKLAPLTMPLPQPNSTRSQPSVGRTSSAYPSQFDSGSSSSLSSSTPFAAPPLRRRRSSNNMQLDSPLSSLRASGLPALPPLDLSSPFSGRSSLPSLSSSLSTPPIRPASVMPPSSGGLDSNFSGDEEYRSHTSRGVRKYTRRTTFSNAQLEVMEKLWRETEYPNLDQLDACAAAAGLSSKQVRTWFGNTRQARLAGTRREARNAGIPGVPGSGVPLRGLNESSLSTLNQLGPVPIPTVLPSRVPIIATPELGFRPLPPRLEMPSPFSTSSSSGSSRITTGSGDDYFKAPRRGYAQMPPLPPLPGGSGSRSRRQSFAGYSGGLSSAPDLSFGSGLSSSPSSSSSTGSSGPGFYSGYDPPSSSTRSSYYG